MPILNCITIFSAPITGVSTLFAAVIATASMATVRSNSDSLLAPVLVSSFPSQSASVPTHNLSGLYHNFSNQLTFVTFGWPPVTGTKTILCPQCLQPICSLKPTAYQMLLIIVYFTCIVIGRCLACRPMQYCSVTSCGNREQLGLFDMAILLVVLHQTRQPTRLLSVNLHVASYSSSRCWQCRM